MGFGHTFKWKCDKCHKGDALGAEIPRGITVDEILFLNGFVRVGKKCYHVKYAPQESNESSEQRATERG